MIRSPIKWVGGKYKLRKQLVQMLPPHACYVEVFGGAAWVLFAKEPSKVEVLNDIDGELINFFRVIQDKPETFIESFEWTLISRDEFERLKHLSTEGMTNLERAYRFYYLIMASWGGEFHSPRFQTSVNDGGHGNRLIGAIKNLHQRVMPAHHRLRTVIIENLDWNECIDRYDREGVVMYLDPPYPGNNVNYQHNLRQWEHHVQIVERLQETKAKWLLSTYDLPPLRELFSGFFITRATFASGMAGSNGRRNHEIIVSNYDPAPLMQRNENRNNG